MKTEKIEKGILIIIGIILYIIFLYSLSFISFSSLVVSFVSFVFVVCGILGGVYLDIISDALVWEDDACECGLIGEKGSLHIEKIGSLHIEKKGIEKGSLHPCQEAPGEKDTETENRAMVEDGFSPAEWSFNLDELKKSTGGKFPFKKQNYYFESNPSNKEKVLQKIKFCDRQAGIKSKFDNGSSFCFKGVD